MQRLYIRKGIGVLPPQAAQDLFAAIGEARGTLAAVEHDVADGVRAGAISAANAGAYMGALTEASAQLAMIEARTSTATTQAEAAALAGEINQVRGRISAVDNSAHGATRTGLAVKYGLWTLGGLAVAGVLGFWILRHARRG